MQLLKESPLSEKILESKSSELKEVSKLKEKSKLKVLSAKLDKPIVFNSRIRSSGYNAPNVRREKFTPLTNTSKKSPSLQNLNFSSNPKTATKSGSGSGSLFKKCFKFSMPNDLKNKIIATDNNSCLTNVEFSGKCFLVLVEN